MTHKPLSSINEIETALADNMVFTQSRGFDFGASFGLQIRSLRCRVLVCHAADTASLATGVLFGKLVGIAITFGFGGKRCRKNLPLVATDFSDGKLDIQFPQSRFNRC